MRAWLACPIVCVLWSCTQAAADRPALGVELDSNTDAGTAPDVEVSALPNDDCAMAEGACKKQGFEVLVRCNARSWPHDPDDRRIDACQTTDGLTFCCPNTCIRARRQDGSVCGDLGLRALECAPSFYGCR